MKKRLKRNIVIPVGTVFETAPHTTERFGDDHFEHVIGLTPNSAGSLTYCVDPGDSELADWFEDVE